MSYEEQLFDEVIYNAAEELSPSDATDLREWVESLECAKRKADEYEAKAKAFDAIMREWEDERVTKSHTLETIKKYYNKYESGGYDAKK